jgi:hypothetical protein
MTVPFGSGGTGSVPVFGDQRVDDVAEAAAGPAPRRGWMAERMTVSVR